MTDWSQGELWAIYAATWGGAVFLFGIFSGLSARYPAGGASPVLRFAQGISAVVAFACPLAFGFELAPAYAQEGRMLDAAGVFMALPLLLAFAAKFLAKLIEQVVVVALGGSVSRDESVG